MAESLTRAVREAVSKELRDALLVWAPRPSHLPCQIASEELVLSAIFTGKAVISDAELVPEDFWVPLHRHIFAAFQLIGAKEPTEVRVLAALKALKVHGDPERLLDELLDIRVAPEILQDDAVSDFQTHVSLIREASQARQLIRWLRKLEEDLMLGRLTAQEARKKLRPHEPPNGNPARDPRRDSKTLPDGSRTAKPPRTG